MTCKKLLYLILVFLGLTSPASYSATATTTFTVTATIVGVCQIAATNLAFGNYNPTLGAVLNGTSTVTPTCTISTPYSITLDLGTGAGASLTNRFMTRTVGGTETIAYNLYSDPGHTTVWANTEPTTVSGTGTGNPQPLTVYGQIFASNPTTLPPASYSDTITATITY